MVFVLSFLSSRLAPALPIVFSLAVAFFLASAYGESPGKPAFSAAQLEFFEREVKPILKANCLNCHGGEKKVQSGLYLAAREC
jgi:hypothetical protein